MTDVEHENSPSCNTYPVVFHIFSLNEFCFLLLSFSLVFPIDNVHLFLFALLEQFDLSSSGFLHN